MLALLYEKQGNTSPTREGKEKKPLQVNARVSTGNPAAVFLPRRPLRANVRWGWGWGWLGRCSKQGKAHSSAPARAAPQQGTLLQNMGSTEGTAARLGSTEAMLKMLGARSGTQWAHAGASSTSGLSAAADGSCNGFPARD